MVLAFGAANRDPDEFTCPEAVVTDRNPNRHLGFGFGAHRCIGSLVAKLDMRIAVEELTARYERIELDPAGVIALSSGLNQGIVALPIVLHPRRV